MVKKKKKNGGTEPLVILVVNRSVAIPERCSCNPKTIVNATGNGEIRVVKHVTIM